MGAAERRKGQSLNAAQWSALRQGIADLMVEDILSTTDEDILAEVKEDFGDVAEVVTQTRGVLQRVIDEFNDRQANGDDDGT